MKTQEMIKNFIKKINDEKKLSDGTIKNYTNTANSISIGNIATAQPTLITKLKSNYENPNSLALSLNVIILIRKDNELDTDKLIKFRNTLSDSIRKTRKDNLSILDPKLPSAEEIKIKLENMSGIRYIVNYLMIYNGLRNKDINLKYVKSVPKETDENYIMFKKNNTIELSVADYKTKSKYGIKKIEIDNERFIDEFKSMDIKIDGYILPLKNGGKIKNVSTFNEKIVKYTIDNLGQNKIAKIIVKDMLTNNNYDQLEELAKDRGTSLNVILKSYNLQNVENKPPEPEPEKVITFKCSNTECNATNEVARKNDNTYKCLLCNTIIP